MNQIGGTHSNPGYNSMGGSPMGNRMGGGFGGGMNPGGGHGNTFRVGSGYNPNMRDNVIPFSAAHGGNNFGGNHVYIYFFIFDKFFKDSVDNKFKNKR